MTSLHGFTLIEQRDVPEINCTAQIWRHDKTGARLASMLAEDENKVFGITFRTPPKDSTGVAHILEHSVLCGSRKYPVKEPFVELLKGSLQTFLNAFTYPDKTCYPVASTNHQDFRNLIDVYLDAVFHPRLSPEVLAQEGWHYEIDAPDGPLSYKGVVYNEMKGVYSSPDSQLSELSQQAVFPDTTYGLDSGGNPAVIPQLTWEAFQDFHTRYYHPSNAWIWFYGDDDPDERLAILDAYLSEFGPLEVDSGVGTQQRLHAPGRVERSFAAGGPDEKAMLTVNWLLTRTEQAETNLALHMLEELLIGLPSSPLRKALIDSQLGEDMTGVGLEAELRQMYFSVGLKGVAQADAEKVEELIRTTLESVASEGISQDLVEAAVNTVEFALRENNTGRFPRGLALMLRALTHWLYDADPLEALTFETPLAAIKERLAAGEPLFESLIRTHLLDNPHRMTVLLTPDEGLAAEREAEEQGRLDAVLAGMDVKAREAVAEEARLLDEKQRAHDAPEALATIPRLTLADLPRENQLIPCQDVRLGDVPGLWHDLPTAGIVYLDVAFDLRVLPMEYLACVPLFGRALLEMGTEKEDFVSLTRRIARTTGGVDASEFVGSAEGGGEPVGLFTLRGKATLDKCSELTSILSDVLCLARFDDRERFRQMLLEEKARQEERLIPAGHAVVAARLKAGLSAAGAAAEQLNGVENLFFLRRLVDAVDNDWPRVLATLEEMRTLLLRRGPLTINVTVDAAGWDKVRPCCEVLAAAIPPGGGAPQPWQTRELPLAEGLSMPAQVNYVGRGVNLGEVGYTPRGQDLVVARYLRTAYLWDAVRVRGGAYGAFSMLERLAETLVMCSYRDPNLLKTLEAFDGAQTFLQRHELTADELTKAVTGAVGDLDAYQLPDAKGFTSLLRRVQGVTDEHLQQLRDEVLATNPEDFKRFGRAVGYLAKRGRTVVLGSPQALEALSAQTATAVTKLL